MTRCGFVYQICLRDTAVDDDAIGGSKYHDASTESAKRPT